MHNQKVKNIYCVNLTWLCWWNTLDFFSLRKFFLLLPSLLVFSVNTVRYTELELSETHRGIAACYFPCLQRNVQSLIRTLCWSEIISCIKGEGLMEHLLGICRIVWLSLSLIKDKTFLKESKWREKVSEIFFPSEKFQPLFWAQLFFLSPQYSGNINMYPCLIVKDLKSETIFCQWVGSETLAQILA